MIFFWTIWTTLMLLTVLLAIRNPWVYRTRIWMIQEDMDQFRRMPTYSQMMFRFWIWDARGFGWVQR